VLFVSNLILRIIFSCSVFFSFDTALDFVFFYLMSASPVLKLFLLGLRSKKLSFVTGLRVSIFGALYPFSFCCYSWLSFSCSKFGRACVPSLILALTFL
jgi:hypothetical protein